MKTVIEMALESKVVPVLLAPHGEYFKFIEHFAELVRADEREKYKWDVHSCGPTCTKVACVAMREAVKAEREACAKVCDDFERAKWESVKNISQNGGRLAFAGPMQCAAAIRAKGQA